MRRPGRRGARRRVRRVMAGWVVVGILVAVGPSGAVGAEGAAGAQDAGPSPGSPVGCEEAVRVVLARHATVDEKLRAVVAAEAAAGIGPWVPAPELRVRSDAGTINRESRLGVRVPVPAPGLTTARAQADAALVARAAARAEWQLVQLAAEVRKAFAAARFAWRERELSDRLAVAARERATAVEHLMQVGSATVLERETAAVRATAATEAARQAQERAARATQAVADLTGYVPALRNGACAPPSGEAIDQVLARHPELRMARDGVAAAEQEMLITTRRRWVWPSFVEMSWVHDTAKSEDGVLVQAGVEVPVSRGRPGEAEARREELELARQVAEQRVRAAVEEAERRYRDAQATVQRLEADADRMRQARELAQHAGDAGAAVREVWDLEREVADWDRRRLEAEYGAELAAIEWRVACGER